MLNEEVVLGIKKAPDSPWCPGRHTTGGSTFRSTGGGSPGLTPVLTPKGKALLLTVSSHHSRTPRVANLVPVLRLGYPCVSTERCCHLRALVMLLPQRVNLSQSTTLQGDIRLNLRDTSRPQKWHLSLRVDFCLLFFSC